MVSYGYLSPKELVKYIVENHQDSDVLIHSYSRSIPLTIFLCVRVRKETINTISRGLEAILYREDLDLKIADISEFTCTKTSNTDLKRYSDKNEFKKEFYSLIEFVINEFETKDLHKYLDHTENVDIGYFVDGIRVDIMVILNGQLLFDITTYGEQPKYLEYLTFIMSELTKYGDVLYSIVNPVGYDVEILKEYDEDKQKTYIDIVLTLKYYKQEE